MKTHNLLVASVGQHPIFVEIEYKNGLDLEKKIKEVRFALDEVKGILKKVVKK